MSSNPDYSLRVFFCALPHRGVRQRCATAWGAGADETPFLWSCVWAGEALEYATFLSTKAADTRTFELHIAQVKAYYRDFKCVRVFMCRGGGSGVEGASLSMGLSLLGELQSCRPA